MKLLAIPLILLSAATLAAPAPLDYRIEPVLDGQALKALRVVLRVEGETDGTTLLHLPGEWAGSGQLWQHLSHLTVEGSLRLEELDAGTRRIHHPPGADLIVRYRVNSAYTEAPGFDYQKAKPLVLADWFFAHGEGVFAFVEGRDDAPVRFRFEGFPRGWRMASDLEHFARKSPGTQTALAESVLIGAPDLAITERKLDGVVLRVATRGSWRFATQDFTDAVIKLVAAANRRWGEAPSRFLVTLAPLGGALEGHSAHGTGRGDAFSVAATAGLELPPVLRLLAHEYQHTWFPEAFGGHVPETEASGYWFSEGFTDLYAARVMLDAGLWDAQAWVDDLNTTLFRHATSPARAAREADIVARFWSDQAMQKLPYDRGQIIALGLESRLRAASAGREGLHAALLALRTRARQTPAPARDGFLAVLGERLGAAAVAEVEALADGRVLTELPADLLPACLVITTIEQPEFHRGFDIEATLANGRIVQGTDPALPAFAAGLRDGMRLVRREGGRDGDSRVVLTYHVEDAGTPRALTYQPEGHARIRLQEVSLAPGAPADCASSLAGQPQP